MTSKDGLVISASNSAEHINKKCARVTIDYGVLSVA